MKIEQLKLGPMDNFSYVLWDETSKEAAVIDPAWQPEAIESFLKAGDLRLQLLLLTHAHPDHVNAAGALQAKRPGLKLTLHKADLFLLETDAERSDLLAGGEELRLGGVKIKVLHTPGHTPGSVSYLAEGAVFTGDTLFIGACGRVDLPGSDPESMRQSLLKLATLADETTVYPGHAYNGSVSTIGIQREYNLYIKLAAKSEKEFLKAAL